MKRVLSLILSAALSLSVFFALPLLPNGELPTDPNPITTENGEDEGETENPEDDGSGIRVCEGFPDGSPNIQ